MLNKPWKQQFLLQVLKEHLLCFHCSSMVQVNERMFKSTLTNWVRAGKPGVLIFFSKPQTWAKCKLLTFTNTTVWKQIRRNHCSLLATHKNLILESHLTYETHLNNHFILAQQWYWEYFTLLTMLMQNVTFYILVRVPIASTVDYWNQLKNHSDCWKIYILKTTTTTTTKQMLQWGKFKKKSR